MVFFRTTVVLAFCIHFGASNKVTDQDSLCQENWFDDGQLYGLGCIFVDHTSPRTWEEAAIYCQQEQNATLLEMDNWEQLQYMMDILNTVGCSNYAEADFHGKTNRQHDMMIKVMQKCILDYVRNTCGCVL